MINPIDIGDAAKNAATAVIHALKEAAANDTSEPRLFFPNGINEIEISFTVTHPDGTRMEFEMEFEGAEESDFASGGWYEDEGDFDMTGDDEEDDDDEETPVISNN
jgi:hypothetical protein